MKKVTLLPANQPLHGELNIPGDKSISHRAIMLGSLATGTTNIQNFLDGEDCLHTVEIFRHFGVQIEQSGTEVEITSKGYKQFTEPKVPLYFGNSGTTARLMLGILTGIPFYSVMYGDPYLTIRPMDRVVTPLKLMNAQIDGRAEGKLLPLSVRGSNLKGIHYELPVKSAQVKSAVLLAGLFADGETTVIEQVKTRDHTENMLRAFGADITVDGLSIRISNQHHLSPVDVIIPGDISSAAFFMVAAAIVPNSNIILKNIGLNATRTGIIDVLIKMGANLTIQNEREISGELLGDVTIQYADLKGMVVEADLIPRLIDEIPIIALLATQAKGTTVIKDAEELRVKETDRIKAVVDVLSTLGAKIEETDDGMVIHGKTDLQKGEIKSYGDHRIAMMGAIAALVSKGTVAIDDTSSIAISYPTFFDDLKQLKIT